jgi:pyruvate-formate lyase-activating enzyme
MPVDRSELYRLPWSTVDTAGAWVEVTDACDFRCPGCYRHRLAGHRSLDEVKDEVTTIRRLTNCDRIAVAGGEPLLWPHTVELIEFIARNGIKPVLLTHGEHLTESLGRDLQRAGLAKFHFHVDAGMQRPGWTNRSETEMNELRQRFADLVWELDGVQCGFNITVFRSTLPDLPAILDWCRRNMHKVQHVSLIAFRSIPLAGGMRYRVGEQWIDPSTFQHSTADLVELTVTTEAMLEVLQKHDPTYRPCTYLSGTTAPETYKFLVTIQVGSVRGVYGYLGRRSLEMLQVGYHVIKGRYPAFLRKTRVGRKLFLLGIFDPDVRRAARRYLGATARDLRHGLEGIYTQSISLQQPNEILDGEPNLCDGCLNMMLYQGRLIPSCRLDEYRLFGDKVVPVPLGSPEIAPKPEPEVVLS